MPPTPTPTPTATPTPSATPTPGPADAPTIDPNGHNTCPNPITVTIQSDTPGAHLRVVGGPLDADINNGIEIDGNIYQTCLLMHSDYPTYFKAKAFLPGQEETTSSEVVVSEAFTVPPPSDCGGGSGGSCDENGPLRPAGGDGTTATATYNGNGAMTSNFDGSAYTYDSMNRLLSASQGGVSVQYYYDGLNRQIARTVNGVATYSVYDGWNLIGEYSSGSTTASLAWVYGAAGMIKELVSGNYYYQDSLGSTSHLADSTGALLEWYRYDLQGTPIFYKPGTSGDVEITASAYGITHLYTGQRWYSALGLYDLRNRYYSPDIGRFLQPDPIGFNGDASNLYRYGANNPVNQSDPTGLWGEVTGSGINVNINLRINYTGPGLSSYVPPGAASAFNAGIMSLIPRAAANAGYNVSINLQAGPSNVVVVNQYSGISQTPIGGGAGTTWYLAGSQFGAAYTAAHEALHLLGLPDLYQKDSEGYPIYGSNGQLIPLKGVDPNNIMVGNGGTLLTRQQVEALKILNSPNLSWWQRFQRWINPAGLLPWQAAGYSSAEDYTAAHQEAAILYGNAQAAPTWDPFYQSDFATQFTNSNVSHTADGVGGAYVTGGGR